MFLFLVIQTLQNSISEQDFLNIYTKYNQLLLKVARDNLLDKSFTLDCVQDTFLGLIPNYDLFADLDEKKQKKKFGYHMQALCNKNQQH